jgi:SsrA-binding protein
MADKIIARNKKAGFEFFITETYEAGLQLLGTEVKSLKDGGGSITDSFAKFKKGELFVYNMNIPPYSFGNIMNHEPERLRKILMHKKELLKMRRLQEQQGFVIIPLKLYIKNGLIKLEIGIGKGKKLYDKRQSIRKKEDNRLMRRSLKQTFR